ncbi:MAG: hypothetical protein BGP01_00330 [Paludibacter sp. 47-17]|nr:MAG: hypothetical protein ABS72_01505 [Paludibacter sp. SCN 50-10]OJX90095.1 MAG: hypothetical protein BGP01_00330 [Paludibacter sp. 47-17]
MKALKIYVVLLLAVIGTMACEKNELPEITEVEIGHNNSRKAEIGGDLHINALITAVHKIASIRLVIHSDEEDHHHASQIEHASGVKEEWEVNTTFTGVYANVKNTTFHEDIDIPSHAGPGPYHLQLFVTDLEGNQGMFETEIELITPLAD